MTIWCNGPCPSSFLLLVTGQEFELLQEMVNQAAAGLSEVKIFLGFTRVSSPVKGWVTEKKTEVGSGMPLLTMENNGAFHEVLLAPQGAIIEKG